jgi:hypothetical protein
MTKKGVGGQSEFFAFRGNVANAVLRGPSFAQSWAFDKLRTQAW